MHNIAKFRLLNEDFLTLDMVRKPTNARECIKISYIIDIVFLLHVSATLMVTHQEECYVCNNILLRNYVHLLVPLPCLIAQCKVMAYLKLYDHFFAPDYVYRT